MKEEIPEILKTLLAEMEDRATALDKLLDPHDLGGLATTTTAPLSVLLKAARETRALTRLIHGVYGMVCRRTHEQSLEQEQ